MLAAVPTDPSTPADLAAQIEAVLFDFSGVITSSPWPALRASGDGDLEFIVGPYHEDTDHPWHCLERGELTIEEWMAAMQLMADETGRTLDLTPLQTLLGDLTVHDPIVDHVRALRDQGYKLALVTNNVKEGSAMWRSLVPVDELFDGAAAIIHLAGQPGVRLSWADGFQRYVERNITASQRVLESARRAGVPRRPGQRSLPPPRPGHPRAGLPAHRRGRPAGLVTPPLTTLRQNLPGQAEVALDLILRQLRQQRRGRLDDEPELHVRVRLAEITDRSGDERVQRRRTREADANGPEIAVADSTSGRPRRSGGRSTRCACSRRRSSASTPTTRTCSWAS